MANLYEALQSVNFEGQAVQFLLESEGLPTDFSSNGDGTPEGRNTGSVEEDDVFQCGKCKKQFTSFQLFLLHKREHKQGHTANLHNSNVLLPTDERGSNGCSENDQSSASETLYCQLRVDTLAAESSPEIVNPVIFSENDILSLAVEQTSLNMSTTTELLGNAIGTRLPSINCLTKCPRTLKMEETVCANTVANVHFAAPVNEGANNQCDTLVPDMDGNARSDDNRTDELMCCEEVPADSTEMVLLNFSGSQSVKSYTTLLPSVEFAAIQDPGVEYVGCEMALEKNTTLQNVIIDYTTERTQSVTRDNVNEREESVQSQTRNVKANKKIHSGPSLNTRHTTKTCGMDQTSQEHHINAQQQQTSNSMLKCNFCTKLFTKNFDLEQHIRSHTGEKPFQCVVCGRAFAQKSNAKSHMQAHKVWPKDQTTLPKKSNQFDSKKNSDGSSQNVEATEAAPEKTVDYPALQQSYACQFCDATFSAYIELKSHMKKHSDQKVYKCIQKCCLQTFSDLESFLTHTSSAHVTGLQYCCHVCNKKFDNLEALGLHQYSHGTHAKSSNKSRARELVCYKCKRKFRSHAALELHLDTSSHNFPCPCCGKVFTWEQYLRRHLTIHGPEESYPCSECGKCFRTRSYLKTHMLIHSKTRPFVCQHCGVAFYRKDKLTRHLLIHQAVKKYKCPFHNYLGCSREFSRQDKLKRHILTHAVAKQFRCKTCRKTFLRLPQLKEHEKLHCYKERNQKCVNCGIVFRNTLLVSSHTCSNEYHEGSGKRAEVSTTDNSNQNGEGEIKKQKLSFSKARGGKKNFKMGNSSEGEKIIHHCNITPKDDGDIRGDNVPTVEIIVVPVSASSTETAGDRNVYVTYPSDVKDSISSQFLNSTDSFRKSEHESSKSYEESIQQLKITKNSNSGNQ